MIVVRYVLVKLKPTARTDEEAHYADDAPHMHHPEP